MGSRNDKGYGITWYQGMRKKAHRVSAVIHQIIADIDDGDIICHSCDNPACVNPDHLWAGTRGQNNSDRSKKGRNARQKGSAHGMSKLTEQDVRYIKIFLAAGSSQAIIARNFGVSSATISNINAGKTWGHVEVTHAPQGVATGAVLSGKPKAPRQEGF